MAMTGRSLAVHLVLLTIIERALDGKTDRWIEVKHLFEAVGEFEAKLPPAMRLFFSAAVPRTLAEADGLTKYVSFLGLVGHIETRPGSIRLTETGKKIVAGRALPDGWNPVAASLRQKARFGSQA